MSSPNTGLCRRCFDKIEWRKQYRKYKPLTQHATCNICSKRNISMAYHTICTECSFSAEARERVRLALEGSTGESKDLNEKDKVCEMCTKELALKDDSGVNQEMDDLILKEKEKLKEELQRPLKLREEKAIERKIERMLEKEAIRKKEERRAAREGIMNNAVEDSSSSHDLDPDDHHDECEINHNEEDHEGPLDHSHHDWGSDLDHTDDDATQNHDGNDEEDPFLKAVGGSSKLLVGDAYRNMLLEKERLSNLKITD